MITRLVDAGRGSWSRSAAGRGPHAVATHTYPHIHYPDNVASIGESETTVVEIHNTLKSGQ